MTHLVFTYDPSPVVTVAYLLAMVALAAGDGWTLSSRASAHALIVLARRGHDDMSFVLALDRPPAIEITFAPG